MIEKRLLKKRNGFTLVELVFAMAIMLILVGLITINLVNVQQKISLDSVVQEFISDIKQQQIKAMTGDAEGRVNSDSYGTYIESDKYVLFHGSSYVSGEPSNFNINLPNNMQFTTTGAEIVFSRINGEISVPVSIKLEDITNSNSKTIQINKYGIVTGVN